MKGSIVENISKKGPVGQMFINNNLHLHSRPEFISPVPAALI